MSTSIAIRIRNGIYGFLCIGVSLYALSHLLHESFYSFKGSGGIAESPIWRVAFHMHFLGGAVALGLGWTQFLKNFRAKRTSIHRKFGYAYTIAVLLISSPAALYMAMYANGGFNNIVGFTMMALCWFTFTLFAFRAIKNKNVASHEKWMIRSFAVTLAAVSLRLFMPIMIISGVDQLEAYQTIAWFSWVPNLFVAEWLIQRRVSRAAS